MFLLPPEVSGRPKTLSGLDLGHGLGSSLGIGPGSGPGSGLGSALGSGMGSGQGGGRLGGGSSLGCPLRLPRVREPGKKMNENLAVDPDRAPRRTFLPTACA